MFIIRGGRCEPFKKRKKKKKIGKQTAISEKWLLQSYDIRVDKENDEIANNKKQTFRDTFLDFND